MNMTTFKRILVDIDAAAATHPALQQAFDLAARCGAAVTIMDVLPHVPKAARLFATEEIERELVEHRLQSLTRTAGSAPRGVKADVSLLRGRPAAAIIEEARRIQADLVIRSHGRDLVTPPPPFGPVDMQLLRKCPCAVWIVGPDASRAPARIVAAVNAAADDPDERVLNGDILDAALTIRDLWGAQLVALSAWSPFGEELLRSRMRKDQFDALVDESRKTAEDGLAALVAAPGPRAAGVTQHLVKAESHEAILSYVETFAIDLVVMGTVGRGGVAGLVMGNTAERVLRRLRQSVLAIKPRGFTG